MDDLKKLADEAEEDAHAFIRQTGITSITAEVMIPSSEARSLADRIEADEKEIQMLRRDLGLTIKEAEEAEAKLDELEERLGGAVLDALIPVRKRHEEEISTLKAKLREQEAENEIVRKEHAALLETEVAYRTVMREQEGRMSTYLQGTDYMVDKLQKELSSLRQRLQKTEQERDTLKAEMTQLEYETPFAQVVAFEAGQSVPTCQHVEEYDFSCRVCVMNYTMKMIEPSLEWRARAEQLEEERDMWKERTESAATWNTRDILTLELDNKAKRERISKLESDLARKTEALKRIIQAQRSGLGDTEAFELIDQVAQEALSPQEPIEEQQEERWQGPRCDCARWPCCPHSPNNPDSWEPQPADIPPPLDWEAEGRQLASEAFEKAQEQISPVAPSRSIAKRPTVQTGVEHIAEQDAESRQPKMVDLGESSQKGLTGEEVPERCRVLIPYPGIVEDNDDFCDRPLPCPAHPKAEAPREHTHECKWKTDGDWTHFPCLCWCHESQEKRG